MTTDKRIAHIWRDLLLLYNRLADGSYYFMVTILTLAVVIAVYGSITTGHLLTWAITVTTMLYLIILALRMARLFNNTVTLDDLSERIIEFENTVGERLDRIDRNI
jgi:uncharacterized protein (DUF983 family)